MSLTNSNEDHHQPKNPNIIHQQRMGLQDKIALAITKSVGTMYAVYIFVIIIIIWIFWQTIITDQPFDPYPFIFLLFLGNIVQLLLMPLIMVGQNIQGRHAEIRADEEFKTTESSYHDIESILKRLDAQDKELLKQTEILHKLISSK